MFGDGNNNGNGHHQDGNNAPVGDGAPAAPQDGQNVPQPAMPNPTGAPMPTQAATTPGNDAGNYMMDDEPAAAPGVVTVPAAAQSAGTGADELIDIKRHALQQLSPLLNHLDQTPEEKFRTTMMMIQAADDESLISQAYQAALDIPEEKTRAQALLDVVNEINYFTQNRNDTDEAAA